ncbi:MAG: RNA polymerase-binding protein DksA [Nitrospirota bacterium]
MPTTKSKNAKESKANNKYDEIRKELERQKNALLAEAGEIIGSGLNPEKENYPDMTDQAAAESDQNFTLRLKGREQKLLKKIDEALEKIATDTYGICESCGEVIGLKRLMARPVTTLCIECKTRQEQEEKLRE